MNMKRNLIYIILGLIFFTASCKKDEKLVDEFDANFIISNSNLTPLDNALKLRITASYNVTEPIAVTCLGWKTSAAQTTYNTPINTNLGSITLVDGKGTLYIQDSQLGDNVIGRVYYLRLTGKSNDGTDFIRSVTVTVANPFEVHKPTVTTDTTVKDFFVFISPKFATLAPADVNVQVKVNKLGTYVAQPSVYGDSLLTHIVGADYTVGDTVYFKVTATGKTTLTTFGDRTATSTSTMVVGLWKYANADIFKLDTATLNPSALHNMSFDLVKRAFGNTAAIADSADMVLTQTNISGGFTMGFKSNKNAVFVKVNPATAAAFYATGDVKAVNTSDFSSAVTSFNNVLEGDVYLFKTTRGTHIHYGMFNIVSVTKPNGVLADSYIEFELKY